MWDWRSVERRGLHSRVRPNQIKVVCHSKINTVFSTSRRKKSPCDERYSWINTLNSSWTLYFKIVKNEFHNKLIIWFSWSGWPWPQYSLSVRRRLSWVWRSPGQSLRANLLHHKQLLDNQAGGPAVSNWWASHFYYAFLPQPTLLCCLETQPEILLLSPQTRPISIEC